MRGDCVKAREWRVLRRAVRGAAIGSRGHGAGRAREKTQVWLRGRYGYEYRAAGLVHGPGETPAAAGD